MKILCAAMLITLLQTAGPQTGGVEGVVVRARTNEPIDGVELRLSAVNPDAPADHSRPTTDRNGRFSISGLNPGRYLVMALKSGYAAQIYGAKQTGITGLAGIGTSESDLSRAGALIDVVAGQVVRNVVIQMTPAAAVSGRVLGANGEPLVAMQVDLITVTYDATGRRNMIALAQVDTDDRGEYRLFNVEPGRYYIAARWSAIAVARQEVNSELRVVDAADSNGKRYAPAYFPGSADLSHASLVEVKAGDTLDRLDIVMRPPSPQTRRNIRGRLIDSTTGQAPPENSGSSFILIPRDGEFPGSLQSPDDPRLMPDGTFELRDIAEGAYRLFVAVTSARTNGRSAVVPIDVVGGDVEGLVVNVTTAVDVSGRVLLDGAPWSAADAAAIQVRLAAPRLGAFTINGTRSPSPAFFEADGTFVITDVSAGEYDLEFDGLPPDAYVKEARYGSVDALMQRLVINGAAASPLEIRVSTKSGQLNGVVVDADRKPVADVEAVLIPEGEIRRPDRYKTAKTDANGRFLIRGIAPGDYRIYAWENIERFRYFDSEFVRQFEGTGKLVRVEEGVTGTINVDIIPANR